MPVIDGMGILIGQLLIIIESVTKIETVIFRKRILLTAVPNDFTTISTGIQFSSCGKRACLLRAQVDVIALPAVRLLALIKRPPRQLVLLPMHGIRLLHRAVAAVADDRGAVDAVTLLALCHDIDDAADRTTAVERGLTAGDDLDLADILDRDHVPVDIAVPCGIHLLSVDKDEDILRAIAAKVHRAFDGVRRRDAGRHRNGIRSGLYIAQLDILLGDDLYIRRYILEAFCLTGRGDRDALQRKHRNRIGRAYAAHAEKRHSRQKSRCFFHVFHVQFPFTISFLSLIVPESFFRHSLAKNEISIIFCKKSELHTCTTISYFEGFVKRRKGVQKFRIGD